MLAPAEVMLACRKVLTDDLGACSLIQPMLDELKALTAARAGHTAAMNVGAGVLGSRILQILEVTSAVVVPPPPRKNIFSRAVSPPTLPTVLQGACARPTACRLQNCCIEETAENSHEGLSSENLVIARLSFKKARSMSNSGLWPLDILSAKVV